MEDFKILEETSDKLKPKSDEIEDWMSFHRAQKTLPHVTATAKAEVEEAQHNVLKELGKA